MSIFDGLLNPAAIGGAFSEGLDMGTRQREDREVRGALAAYATNPDDPKAFQMLAQHRPELAIQMGDRKREQQAQAQAQRRADLPLMERLLNSAVDEPSYQRALQVAGEYGIDASHLPQAYDPAWVQEQRDLLKLVQDPNKAEALSTAGKQAVDMGYKPGTPEFNKAVHDIWTAGESKPYVVGGETRLYTPKIGGPGQVAGPKAGDVEDGYRFKGGNPADQNNWEPVQGGGGQRVTSNFLGGL